MQLLIFDFIDAAIDCKERETGRIENMAAGLEDFFDKLYRNNDYYLNVTKRIKSSASLREKILRNNLYSKNPTPESLIENLSDLVGIRVECRFINDEKKAYLLLLDAFSEKRAEGFYSVPSNEHIELYLAEKQPMRQKNGFEIYKIDGRYHDEKGSFRFELQIKSLVNEFWGEIDHRILYKNANYILEEEFMRDIMASIKNNLSMIDHQLMTVYDRLSGNEDIHDTAEENYIESLLSKLIHDHYMRAIRKELLFVMDFKEATDLLVKYFFEREKFKMQSELDAGRIFMRILGRISDLPMELGSMSSVLEFFRDIDYKSPFQKAVGQTFRAMMNMDFRWNLFFRMLFDIEEGKNADDFEQFLIFLDSIVKEKICSIISPKNYPKELENKILNGLTMAIADNFRDSLDINIFVGDGLIRLSNQLEIIFQDISDEEEWRKSEVKILNLIRNFDVSE